LSKELVIKSSSDGAEIALLEDKRLIELHHDSIEENFLVGDVYLGRVRKVIPSLNAVFVDIGHEKDAFLHYLDLGPDIRTFNRFVDLVKKGKYKDNRLSNFRFEPQIIKTGKIDEVFTPNQNVVVQIVKEPISTKGPRLSSQISLSGRFIILIPFNDGVSLSKKIRTKQERDRLKKIMTSLKPKNFGLIVRTNAEDASLEDLESDLNKLMADWDGIVKELEGSNVKLYSELDRTASLLRDLVNDSFTRIHVDDPKVFKQIKGYLSGISSNQDDIVKMYKGDRPIFEQFDVDRQIKSLFNKIVNLGGGAYLIIEHTEAMHVIDVNSGSKRNRDDDQEENALRTNLEAAAEIARQLRLRDMGGIIVIDFIDMRKTANRKMVFEKMSMIMKDDRAKNTVLPLTKFGLMQVTRQRVRQEIIRDTLEPCPVCNGTGQINKGELITQNIILAIEHSLEENTRKSVSVKVHPYVHAYLTKGFISERVRWMMRFGKWVNIEPVENYALNQYEVG
jgi:ribonuclease G